MAPPCCPPGHFAAVHSSSLREEHSRIFQNRALRQARLHRQRDARARDRTEIAQLREQLALRPQYVVLPFEKNLITNEIATQTDFDAYENESFKDAALRIQRSWRQFLFMRNVNAVLLIQHSWRQLLFMRKLKLEQGNLARKVVADYGANQMSRLLLRAVRTLSSRSLMARIHGDELPEGAGGRLLESQELGQMAQIFAEEMVQKIIIDQKKADEMMENG